MSLDPIKWMIDREQASMERELQQRLDGTYHPSIVTRVLGHPAGFFAVLVVGIFLALGLGEFICWLVGAGYDPRLG